MKVDALVFSKNRPAQLDLLLRSIRFYAADLYGTVHVLWRGDGVRMRTGYQRLFGVYDDVVWIRESIFNLQTRMWLGLCGSYVSFLCDDDVFYRPGPTEVDAECLPLSLRGGDYDYPFSLDGNIYAHRDVSRLFDHLPRFDNPNELEWFAHDIRQVLPFTELNPYEPPCLVGVPLNKVSDLGSAPHMGMDVTEMNERFLAGERLRVPVEHENDRLAAHEMLDLAWVTPVRWRVG